MEHVCTSRCECRTDLIAATAALEEASRLLSASIFSGSADVIKTRFAFVRAAKVKASGAFAAYQDHFAEA
jgi:hypothetical protein